MGLATKIAAVRRVSEYDSTFNRTLNLGIDIQLRNSNTSSQVLIFKTKIL